jgi:MinD superfamily P-loop ATPase
MKEIVVLSGKGGTGKTTLIASLAVLASNKVMVDCDVDAADLHLLLKPEVKETQEFWSGQKAWIDPAKCTQCGLCQEVCRFGAIKDFVVEEFSCEGCGFCSQVCPVSAVTMKESLSGEWFISETKYGPLVHAKLGIAEENSGLLISLIRQQVKLIAEKQGQELILSDGPPGIGCPVISSLTGADLALLVTEPTLSGIWDLERVLGVCQHFGIATMLCINKYDLNLDNSNRIRKFCQEQGIEVISQIPFDNTVTEALVQGVPVVEYTENRVTSQIKSLWQTISERLL